MRILIVTRSFFPHGDATSAVIQNLSEALLKNDCQVKVLALTSYQSDEKVTEHKGVLISNQYVPETKEWEQLKREWKKKPFQSSIVMLRKLFFVLQRRYDPKLKKLSLNPLLANAYRKTIKNELANHKYDACLITLMPHEAVWAFPEKEAGQIPVAVYQLDTYWNNDAFPEQLQLCRKVYEKQLVSDSKFVLTTPQIASVNAELWPELSAKWIASEFPMIKETRVVQKEEDGNVHCIFLGTLYQRIRPPEKVVAILAGLDLSNVVFDFYGTGQDLIAAAADYPKAENMIRLHGSVSSEAAEQIRQSADILVNIDNTSLQQVPSKIFEYISTGKPIINFYFNQQSYILDYLSQYPLCLNVYLGEKNVEENVSRMASFLQENTGKRVSFETIRRVFMRNTPEFVAQQCMEAFQKR